MNRWYELHYTNGLTHYAKGKNIQEVALFPLSSWKYATEIPDAIKSIKIITLKNRKSIAVEKIIESVIRPTLLEGENDIVFSMGSKLYKCKIKKTPFEFILEEYT